MAQLDSLTYSSQVFWVVCVFFSFYVCVILYLFPIIYRSIRVRTFIIEKFWFKSLGLGLLNQVIHNDIYQRFLWLTRFLCIYFWRYQKVVSFNCLLFVNTFWLYLRSISWIFLILLGVRYTLVN